MTVVACEDYRLCSAGTQAGLTSSQQIKDEWWRIWFAGNQSGRPSSVGIYSFDGLKFWKNYWKSMLRNCLKGVKGKLGDIERRYRV